MSSPRPCGNIKRLQPQDKRSRKIFLSIPNDRIDTRLPVAFETLLREGQPSRLSQAGSFRRCATTGCRQLNAGKPNMHHDALACPDGGIVWVTRLCEGQHATVLQLPASPHSAKDEAERKHAAVVG